MKGVAYDILLNEVDKRWKGSQEIATLRKKVAKIIYYIRLT